MKTPYHHGSHLDLLGKRGSVPTDPPRLDAIVVPTARASANLDKLIQLASQLNCALIALCSRWASAPEAELRAKGSGVELVAIDTKGVVDWLLPQFATSELLSTTTFSRRQDTSLKRNLGLLFARLAGWQRIVFLDDDIIVPRPEDLLDAAATLQGYDAVGLSIDGFPDNSVVCHAYRDAGGSQETFVGGGALAVNPMTTTSFFPNIYNEDWFFLLDNSQLRRTTVVGRVVQQIYDPYANPGRARAEEFGDCLAEGVFWLLDNGWRVKDADVAFWERFLRNRQRFINQVIVAVAAAPDIDLATKARMTESLKAARGRHARISPELCVQYLHAWRIDSRRWQRHLAEHSIPIGSPVDKVLSDLGLQGCSRYLGPAS